MIRFPFHRMKSFRKYSIARTDYDWKSSAYISKKAKKEDNMVIDIQGGDTDHSYIINVTYIYNKQLSTTEFFQFIKVKA
jgi:hypothetical protein